MKLHLVSKIATPIVIGVLTVLTSGALAQQQSAGYKGYPRGGTLITARELKRLIDTRDSKLVIIAAENDLEYRTAISRVLINWTGRTTKHPPRHRGGSPAT